MATPWHKLMPLPAFRPFGHGDHGFQWVVLQRLPFRRRPAGRFVVALLCDGCGFMIGEKFDVPEKRQELIEAEALKWEDFCRFGVEKLCDPSCGVETVKRVMGL